MNKYYTRAGDDGMTGILGEERLPKNHPRLEAVGSIDEATAALGVARACCKAQRCAEIILKIQQDLCPLMSEVSASEGHAERFRAIDDDRIAWLEEQIEAIQRTASPPKEFVIPGDTPGGAALDLARVAVRPPERRVAGLVHSGDLENAQVLRYLNRLSSLCFALELLEIQVSEKGKPTLVTK